MDKQKAQTVMNVLIGQDYVPQLGRDANGSYFVIIQDNTGVPVDAIKTFADNQQIEAKARIVMLT